MKKYKPYLTRVDLVKNQVERERIQEQEAAKKRKQRIQEQNRQNHLRYQEQLRSELAARYFHAVQSTGGDTSLLDTYPAARAYSLRKLSSTYTGNAIRVRRTSDDSEQDFGFVNGEVDIDSIISFVGQNGFANSEVITNGIKFGMNITGTPPFQNVITAPDGTLTADKLIEDTSTGGHGFREATSVTIGNQYNISVYLKAVERTRAYIRSNIPGNGTNFKVDLSNGTVLSNTFSNTPVIEDVGDGWYRCSVGFTATLGSSQSSLYVQTIDTGTNTSYTGDGTSGIYVWGKQLTVGSEQVKTYTKTDNETSLGYVTTWYDQSGNGNNASTSTATRQPTICDYRGVRQFKGKTSLYFNVDELASLRLNALHDGTKCLVLIAGNSNLNTTGNQIMLGSCQISSTRIGYNIGFRNTSNQQFISQTRNGTATVVTTNTATPYEENNDYLISDLIDADESTLSQRSVLRINGTEITNNSDSGTPSTSDSQFGPRIGGVQGSNVRGRISEVIIYDTDQTSNRTAIEDNINTYYSIY
jgi:hypothetical protein